MVFSGAALILFIGLICSVFSSCTKVSEEPELFSDAESPSELEELTIDTAVGVVFFDPESPSGMEELTADSTVGGEAFEIGETNVVDGIWKSDTPVPGVPHQDVVTVDSALILGSEDESTETEYENALFCADKSSATAEGEEGCTTFMAAHV